MTELTLHFEPDGCALVPLIALEAIGHSYRLEVEMPTGQLPRPADAVALHSWASPTLDVDGEAFSGNAAVLIWLTERFSTAHLLPRSRDRMANARLLTDLVFCASTLEPLATCVSAQARSALRPHLEQMDARLAKSRWWYGDQWSIVDAYLHWVWLRVAADEVAAPSYQHLARHAAAMEQCPPVRRALAINRHVAQCLARRRLTLPCAASAATSGGAARRRTAIVPTIGIDGWLA